MQKALASAGSALAKSTQALLERRQFNPNPAAKGNSQWDTVLTTQIDATALLGHANFQLSFRRREMLKPFLIKERIRLSMLLADGCVIFLFGDELQSQLAAIRASNRISHTAIDPERGSVSARRRNQHEVGAPEILKESGLFSTKAPIRGGQPRATPANTNHGERPTRSNSLPNGEHIEWLGGKRIYELILL